MPLTEEEKKERNKDSCKKYRAANIDRVRAYDKERYDASKGNISEAEKSRRRKNAKAYYHRNKDLCKKKVSKWQKNNPEKVKAYSLVTRSKPSYQARMKAYHKENKQRANYLLKKHRGNLPDTYIKSLLTNGSLLTFDRIPQSLIEAKRLQMQMKRYSKEQENG